MQEWSLFVEFMKAAKEVTALGALIISIFLTHRVLMTLIEQRKERLAEKKKTNL